MNTSERIPIIAGVIGFIADVIGIGTFLIAFQSGQEPISHSVPLMIFVVLGYSWFILSWAISRIAILREMNRSKGKHYLPHRRTGYRFVASLAVGALASPIILLTAHRIDPHVGVSYGMVALLLVGLIIFALLCALMPLVHDEDAYHAA